jgi:hypothetical protein
MVCQIALKSRDSPFDLMSMVQTGFFPFVFTIILSSFGLASRFQKPKSARVMPTGKFCHF